MGEVPVKSRKKVAVMCAGKLAGRSPSKKVASMCTTGVFPVQKNGREQNGPEFEPGRLAPELEMAGSG